MLSAHLDVVPAEHESWTSDPFAADERRDVHGTMCVWGRGAVDMKHFAASALCIVLELARSKQPLRRGIKLVLVADEEAGCSHGSLAMVRQHPEWFVVSAPPLALLSLSSKLGLTRRACFNAWRSEQLPYSCRIHRVPAAKQVQMCMHRVF